MVVQRKGYRNGVKVPEAVGHRGGMVMGKKPLGHSLVNVEGASLYSLDSLIEAAE